MLGAPNQLPKPPLLHQRTSVAWPGLVAPGTEECPGAAWQQPIAVLSLPPPPARPEPSLQKAAPLAAVRSQGLGGGPVAQCSLRSYGERSHALWETTTLLQWGPRISFTTRECDDINDLIIFLLSA